MPSKISVINAALRKCGARRVMALTEEYEPLSAALDVLPEVLDMVLRAHPWSHALCWTTLARQAASPPFGFSYAYALPADCLRLVDLRAAPDPDAPAAPCAVAGRSVYCNAARAYARYVARHTEFALWPPDFADAVATRLAVEIAATAAQDSRLPAQLLQLYQLALDDARLADAAADTPQESQALCSILQARAGEG